MIENKVAEKKAPKTEGKTDVDTMINGLVQRRKKHLKSWTHLIKRKLITSLTKW